MKPGEMIVDQRFVDMCKHLGIDLEYDAAGEVRDLRIRYDVDIPASVYDTVRRVANQKCPECGNSVSLAIVRRGEPFFPAKCYEKWSASDEKAGAVADLESAAMAMQEEWQEMIAKLEASTELLMEDDSD